MNFPRNRVTILLASLVTIASVGAMATPAYAIFTPTPEGIAKAAGEKIGGEVAHVYEEAALGPVKHHNQEEKNKVVVIEGENSPGGTVDEIREKFATAYSKLGGVLVETKKQLSAAEHSGKNKELIAQLQANKSEIEGDMTRFRQAEQHINKAEEEANNEEGSAGALELGKVASSEYGTLITGNKVIRGQRLGKEAAECKAKHTCSAKKVKELETEKKKVLKEGKAEGKKTLAIETQEGPERNDPGIKLPKGAGSEAGVEGAINTIGFMLIAIAGASFVLLSLWAALLWTTAGHNYTQVAKAKDQMKRNIIVIATIAGMGMFLHFITLVFSHGL